MESWENPQKPTANYTKIHQEQHLKPMEIIHHWSPEDMTMPLAWQLGCQEGVVLVQWNSC